MKVPIEVVERFHEDFRSKEFTVNDALPYFSAYFEYNPQKAKEKAMRQHTKGIIKSYKDIKGVREYLSFKKDGKWHYVYTRQASKENIGLIRQHLEMLVAQTGKTKSKMDRIIKVLESQMSLFETQKKAQ
jgi:hypothetical protein